MIGNIIIQMTNRAEMILKWKPRPLLSALNVAPRKSGVMVIDIQFLKIKFSGGFAEAVAYDSLTFKTFKGLGARMNVLKGLNRSH